MHSNAKTAVQVRTAVSTIIQCHIVSTGALSQIPWNVSSGCLFQSILCVSSDMQRSSNPCTSTHLKPSVREPALQHIVRQECSEVANVRRVVHCRATTVEGHTLLLLRFELLLASRSCVVQQQRCLRCSFCSALLHAHCRVPASTALVRAKRVLCCWAAHPSALRASAQSCAVACHRQTSRWLQRCCWHCKHCCQHKANMHGSHGKKQALECRFCSKMCCKCGCLLECLAVGLHCPNDAHRKSEYPNGF
jgi:hypothetical protein